MEQIFREKLTRIAISLNERAKTCENQEYRLAFVCASNSLLWIIRDSIEGAHVVS